MPTAFEASYGSGRPAIAFLAEYDASRKSDMPAVIILSPQPPSGGTRVKKVIDRLGGSVLVIGTPAEEVHGEKR